MVSPIDNISNIPGISQSLKPARESVSSQEGVRENKQQEVPVPERSASAPAFEVSANSSNDLEEYAKDLKDEAKLSEIISEAMVSMDPLSSAKSAVGRLKINYFKDKDTGEVVVQLVDKETDEVVRQVPPEETYRLLVRLKEFNRSSSGFILDTEA